MLHHHGVHCVPAAVASTTDDDADCCLDLKSRNVHDRPDLRCSQGSLLTTAALAAVLNSATRAF